MVQVILTVVVLAIIGGITFLFYKTRSEEREDAAYDSSSDLDVIGEQISAELSELARDDDLDPTDLRYSARLYKKRELAKHIDNCIYGVEKSKMHVRGNILALLENELKTEKDVCEILPFDEPFILSPNYQWEVLVNILRKQYPGKVMRYLTDTYNLEVPRQFHDKKTGNDYTLRVFDVELLAKILKDVLTVEDENGEKSIRKLEYSEMLEVLSTIIYNKRYGHGVVDTLRGLDIDGFNFGTSGSIRYEIDGTTGLDYTVTNSVWVQMDAQWIFFSFLDFESVGEMKRIINQLVAWGTTAPMTEKMPYKVNDAFDGSRVTAIRPPAGECWACFLRKFTSGLYSKEKLLNKPTVHNWELPAQLIYYLMRSEQTTAFTGQQNTGKTSMMKAAMADVAQVNIRILEMSFELAIRELYPWKNVITVKPTDYVSSAQLQDLLKKTDGYLSMVGEVAEDIVAARMIQFCLIASAFTIFSHHAKNDADLINGLTNSLVACGEYENHDVAMSTVLDAIKNNVHLDFIKGERVIAYISEIIKLNEIEPYPELSKSGNIVDAVDQLASLQREYYTRTTDRVRFTSRHIVSFNPDTMTYYADEGYSPETLRKILSKLKGDDRKNFIEFYKTNWAHTFNES